MESTCFYCHLKHAKVEAQGVWYCPNAKCSGPGGAWFRRRLRSYKEQISGRHTVNEFEYWVKGTLHNLRKGVFR